MHKASCVCLCSQLQEIKKICFHFRFKNKEKSKSDTRAVHASLYLILLVNLRKQDLFYKLEMNLRAQQKSLCSTPPQI